MVELSDTMSTFVSVYADDAIAELKRDKKIDGFLDYERAALKRKLGNLTHFINDYNSFTVRVASFLEVQSGAHQIKLPFQTID